MIEKLLPLTKNKLEILSLIYTQGETHMLIIAKELDIHPFSVQKTLRSLDNFILQKKAGRTILLSLNNQISGFNELTAILEDYKSNTKNEKVNSLIKQISAFFSYENILICVLFGSYARLSFNKDSDVDILLVVKKKNKEITQKISQLSSLLAMEVSPLIMTMDEFLESIKNNEPTIKSLKNQSQRILINGINKFLEALNGK